MAGKFSYGTSSHTQPYTIDFINPDCHLLGKKEEGEKKKKGKKGGKEKREKEIITARRLSEEPQTLEDLSKKYKISRERIRQIETKAFEKLQKAMLNAAKSNNLLPKN